MELLQLKYFVELSHSQHLTKTAEKMIVSPSAISTSISRLEKELGVTLFDRVGRNISLNQYGAAYLKHIETALQAIENGSSELESIKRSDSLVLTVAMWNPVIYDSPINEFRRQNSNIQFRYVFYDPIISSDNSLKKCDFVVAPLNGFHNRDYVSEHIFDDSVLIAIPPTHPLRNCDAIDLIDFRDEWFIFPTDGSWSRYCKELCNQAGFVPKIKIECDYTLRPKTMLEEKAVSLTTHMAVISGLYAGIPTIRLRSPKSNRPQGIFWQKGRELTSAAKSFKDFLIDYYQRFSPLEHC